MKTNLLLLINLILPLSFINAQVATYGWSKSIGGTETDYGRAVCSDASNNLFITGSFKSTVDLGEVPHQML